MCVATSWFVLRCLPAGGSLTLPQLWELVPVRTRGKLGHFPGIAMGNRNFTHPIDKILLCMIVALGGHKMSSDSCTAPDRDCTNATARNGVRDVHEGRLCNTCWTRIRNQHTVQCSASNCTGRVLEDQAKATHYKGRTKPQPWCRRHEHIALSAATIGQDSRDRILAGYAKGITPDWDSEFGCWNWTGKTINPKSGSAPYGSFWRKSVGSWAAHRLGFHLFFYSSGYSTVIDHRCANRLCVNPLHLQAIPQRINDKLQGKRADREGIVNHWSVDETSRAASAELKDFARSNGLPLRTPEHDYSKPWEAPTFEQAIQNLIKLLDASQLPQHGPSTSKSKGRQRLRRRRVQSV